MSLADLRKRHLYELPSLLEHCQRCGFKAEKQNALSPDIEKLFPATAAKPLLKVVEKKEAHHLEQIRVGVLFSGGQAPGGHDVIVGLFEGLSQIASSVTCVGFLEGPSGLIQNKSRLLTKELLQEYRGQGGFDLLGSGRTKIEKESDFALSMRALKAHKLDALVIIGGDDSNTNAACLAEYLLKENCDITVIGVPKTIDGDLRAPQIELSFGFHTATRVYSELIGNIARDALSAKKYTHFIKLMGRSASHIALECALRTQPNYIFISEEVRQKKQGLKEIRKMLVEHFKMRQEMGKNYGVVLLPEGLIESIPEVKQLLAELSQHQEPSQLSSKAAALYQELPSGVQKQLLAERDPHGNIQVSAIETEQLLIELIKDEVTINPITHFLGYEGRSAFPTNFDANYSYALGKTAALLSATQKSGYICGMTNLKGPPGEWQPWAIPITSLLHLEERKGEMKPVIKKALVDLKGHSFKEFATKRESWQLKDDYLFPGPIQFFGPPELADDRPLLLKHLTD